MIFKNLIVKYCQQNIFDLTKPISNKIDHTNRKTNPTFQSQLLVREVVHCILQSDPHSLLPTGADECHFVRTL